MPTNIFHEISSFVIQVQRCFSLQGDMYTLSDRELQCGIALAYCIEKGLDSPEDFETSIAKMKEVQGEMPMIMFTRNASHWDSRPIRSLNFHAASVLLAGCVEFGRPEYIEEFKNLKKHYGKTVPGPPVKIEYEELSNGTGLWARYELNRMDGVRKGIETPFLKSRTRGILKGLLKIYVEGRREEEVGADNASLSDTESEPEASLSDPATSTLNTTRGDSHAAAPPESFASFNSK
jgi:hypothetical protein